MTIFSLKSDLNLWFELGIICLIYYVYMFVFDGIAIAISVFENESKTTKFTKQFQKGLDYEWSLRISRSF